MGTQRVQFARQYRAALLDFLLGSGESGRERALTLGRQALESGLGLLHIIRVHQNALNAILESTDVVDRSLRRLQASQDFLFETLSPFEMTYRGYLELLKLERRQPE